MDKMIITVATTGAMTTKENTPHLPTQPDEIAEEVYGAYQAGAAIAHTRIVTLIGRCADHGICAGA